MPKTPHHVAQDRPGGVRTPDGLSCPVCRETPLRRRQTVCSGKCRAARWRRQQETTREAHDREIRELLKAASPKALLRSSPLGTPDFGWTPGLESDTSSLASPTRASISSSRATTSAAGTRRGSRRAPTEKR